MGTPLEKPNFTIYSVDYTEPAMIKFRTDQNPPVLYTLTRDDDIVTLFLRMGVLVLFTTQINQCESISQNC